MSSELPASTAVADRAVAEQLKKVVKRIHDLPSFPLVIRKLVEVADNVKSSARDLADVMETDQGLSGKVLKLVNSAFYSFSKPVSSLQHAVTLLGYNSIRSLAMSVSVKGIFQDKQGFDQEPFWEHSLATALGAKFLGERNGFPLKDDLFTAGLLHDVGILLEARYFPDEVAQVFDSVRHGAPMVEAEAEYLGVSHPLLGAWLAEQWRLPIQLREPISRHHEFAEDALADLSGELQMMVRYVSLANIVVNEMGYSTVRSNEPTEAEPAKLRIPPDLKSALGKCSLPSLMEETEYRLQQSREFLNI